MTNDSIKNRVIYHLHHSMPSVHNGNDTYFYCVTFICNKLIQKYIRAKQKLLR